MFNIQDIFGLSNSVKSTVNSNTIVTDTENTSIDETGATFEELHVLSLGDSDLNTFVTCTNGYVHSGFSSNALKANTKYRVEWVIDETAYYETGLDIMYLSSAYYYAITYGASYDSHINDGVASSELHYESRSELFQNSFEFTSGKANSTFYIFFFENLQGVSSTEASDYLTWLTTVVKSLTISEVVE